MTGFVRFVLPLALAASPAAAQVQPAVVAPPMSGAVADDPMPTPPAVVAATYTTPPRDASGRYATPNRDLATAEATWHLRVALNVAALGCRDAQELATVAAYNDLLTRAKAPLAEAQAQVAALYRTRHGAAAQARNDDAMTKLYNFFAQPTGHDAFCATAKAVLTEVATVDPTALSAYAGLALPRLEAPFLSFFAAFDSYRDAMGRWQARRVAAQVPAAPVETMVAAVAVPAPAAAPAPPPAVTQVAAVTAPTAAPAATPTVTLTTATGQQVTIALTPAALQAILAGAVAAPAASTPTVQTVAAQGTTPPTR